MQVHPVPLGPFRDKAPSRFTQNDDVNTAEFSPECNLLGPFPSRPTHIDMHDL